MVALNDRMQPPELKSEPVFDAASIQLLRRMRFNPLRMLDPENLSQALDHFDIGILGQAALLWDAMIRRDDTLSFVVPQLENAIAGKPWGVFKKKNADPKEAARHAAALEYFYGNVTAVDAFDRNVRGDRHLLLKQMGRAYATQYAVHHFVWKPQPGELLDVEGAAPVPKLTAELEAVPLWYFENTTGTLRFLPMGNAWGVTGEEINFDGEWLCTTGQGAMFAAAICYVFKRLTFQDWTIFNERYAQSKVLGMTPESADSEQGRAMAEVVANFNSDMGMVLYGAQPTDKPPIQLVGPSGTASVDIFERFLARQDNKMTVMFRGSAQANIAADKKETGITAQINETEALELAHCRSVAGSCREIDRQVIRFCFGEGVEPLAFFGLPDMDQENAQELRESAGFLADRGVMVEADTVAERLGITLTEKPEDALQAIGAPSAAGDSTAAEKLSTANARKAARLEHLVEEALRTLNAGGAGEARDEFGRWTADPSAGILAPEEARAQLASGIDTKDVFGNPVRFDQEILDHWDEEGHSPKAQDRRLRRLPDAVKAVETPHEVWRGGNQTVHLRAFADEKSKRRYMAGFITENGKARSFFHVSRATAVRKFRKGERLYVRP